MRFDSRNVCNKSFACLFAIPRFYGQICVKFEMQGMSASLENSINSTGNRNVTRGQEELRFSQLFILWEIAYS